MPLMTCRPGAGLWTRDSTHYNDDGSGEVFVEDKHLPEALIVGWKPLGRLDKDTAENIAADVVDKLIARRRSEVIDYDPGDVHEEPDESPQSIHTTSELTVEEPTSSRRSARR